MKALLPALSMLLGLTQLSCGDDLRARQLDLLPASTSLLPACETKRLRVVYTAPETLRLGEHTQLEAEVVPDPLRTGYLVSWWLANDPENTARGTLTKPEACKPASTSCVTFTCTGTGGKALDAGVEAPVSGLWVVARYEDPSCYDTSRIPLRCALPLR